MGGIVFSTIVENVKSFFSKEEELLAQPKPVPESASEALAVPRQAAAPARIVEKPLPFSPDDLRAALEKSEPQQPALKEKPKAVEPAHDIEHEIHAFEAALTVAPPAVQKAQQPSVKAPPPTPQPTQEQGTFFGEFSHFLMQEDIDAEGILEKDVLHRMREFHRHHKEGREYYIASKDVQAAVQRKLRELKTLEQEWFHTRQQLDDLERGMTDIEHEIEERTRDLKRLLTQARSRSRLEREAEAGKEFVLSDGRKLRSLLDLKIALRTMPDEVFHHHVTASRNDFSAWVLGAMNDPELSAELGRIRDRHQMDVFLSRLAG